MALLLNQQRIASTLVEQRAEISWVPRARNLNFRTLEVFRGLRLAEEVHAVSQPASRVFRKTSLGSPQEEQLADASALAPANMTSLSPEPFMVYCPQSRSEPILRAAAEKRGCDVRYANKLVSFTQDEAGVTATLTDAQTGRSYVVRADYLVGADGAHSPIREALRIRSAGYGALPEYLVFIYFRAPWHRLMAGHESDAVQVRNASVDGMFLFVQHDLGLLMQTYRPAAGESFEDFTFEHCKQLVELGLGQPGIPVEIVDRVHFQAAESVAECFDSGRVFLVGDAAHTMPGYKGLGLNTAIQSCQNLAWKLASVLHGRASPELLTTYQTERHPVGVFAAHQSLTGPAAAVLPMGARSQLLPEQEERPIFYPIAGYRYRSTAILSEDAARIEQELALVEGEEFTGQPGTRVPHVWFEGEGRRTSTLDLLDGRFVLLTGAGSNWAAAAGTAPDQLRGKLAVFQVGEKGNLLDAQRGWSARLGVTPDGAVLVRPDGFVAWRSNGQSNSKAATALTDVLSSILGKSAAT
jgi:2-polyprenyl-6-methoxyphenol hydroxylase-like FAD-dependent oxidoreductase